MLCGKPSPSDTITSMIDELQQQLNALARDDCYRVDAVLKETELERTERVFFVGANGAEQGPYVRKTFAAQAGMGSAYRRILAAQHTGVRFVHLPRVIDCYEAGEREVVVMEWLPGRTLADEVYACNPSLALAYRLFPQACDAVRELHERFDPPVIHRDIKPSNFMVLGNTVMLIDLGISRTFDAAASTDTRHFGTRAYAPPEQFGYGQTDVRSDVYALGMLLFYLLCEETPEPATLDEHLWAHGVPLEVRDIVQKATAFDPANRYQSVAELEAVFKVLMPEQRPGNYSAAGQTATALVDERVDGALQPAGASCAAPLSPGLLPKDRKLSFASLRNRCARASDKLCAWLYRVPVGVGVAWDALLLVHAIFWLAVCINSAFNPVGDTEQLPFAACAVSYAAVWLLLMSPVPVMLDVRPFRSRVPWLSKLRWLARLGVGFGMLVVSAAVLVIIGMVFVKP